MRVLLSAIDSKFIHSNLALRYLKKIAEGKNCTVFFREFTINQPVDQILTELVEFQADVVVFSCYIWNIDYIRKLISALVVIRPGMLILTGGPEVAYDAADFLESTSAHAVMAAEGEVVFPQVLDQLIQLQASGENQTRLEGLRGIPGLWLKLSEEIQWTGQAPLADMASIPFPYDAAELRRLDHRLVYYEGQRGCPFQCSYCLSAIDRSIRHKPLAMVQAELSVLMKAGVPLVKFVDRTFNIREDWAYEVLAFLIRETKTHGCHTAFHFEVGAASLSARLIELLRSAPPGLFQIEAGIQSTDSGVLKLIRRRDDPLRLAAALSAILETGNVHVHTDLIAGLPGDTLASFQTSFNECIRMMPQMLQVGFLKVLKGTPLYADRHRLGIRHREWPPYEVLETATLSYEELELIHRIESVTEKYFNSGKFPCTMKYLLMNYEVPWELFINLANSLSKYHQSGHVPQIEDYYRTIWEMGAVISPEKSLELAEILRFDYILSNRKGTLPEWLQNDKYNSSRVRIIFSEKDNLQLKGSVVRFKINMLRFWQTSEWIEEDQQIFYSLAHPELIPVRTVAPGQVVPV